MINDFDYKPVNYGIYFDDVTRHLSNIVNIEMKWDIPELSKEEVSRLHKKLETIQSSLLLENDKKILHGFVDILSETKEKESKVEEEKKVLNDIDNRLANIAENIERIYNEETFNIYAILNLLAIIILIISWFLIARFT